MSRNFYDIDPAGEVLCTYTDGGEKERLKAVSVDVSTLCFPFVPSLL